jgi:hypothetical protein
MRGTVLVCSLFLFCCASELARAQSAPGAPPANGQFRFRPDLSAPPFSSFPATPDPTHPRRQKLVPSSPSTPWAIDPRIVIHPSQSAIGTLPPAIHVLPKLYPNLTMLLIHADTVAAALPAR